MTNRIEHTTTQFVNVLAMVKGEQRYVFIYTDENRKSIMGQMGKFAADPELDFSWYDAALCQRRVREESHDQHP